MESSIVKVKNSDGKVLRYESADGKPIAVMLANEELMLTGHGVQCGYVIRNNKIFNKTGNVASSFFKAKGK